MFGGRVVADILQYCVYATVVGHQLVREHCSEGQSSAPPRGKSVKVSAGSVFGNENFRQ